MSRSARILATSLLASFAPTETVAQISGSIYSSDRNGSVVNGNVYATKTQVYLSGGPGPNSPCSGQGLPDGDYYFQVTNPSGSALLSSDTLIDRRVTVVGGVVRVYTGSHRTGNGRCSSTTVQLAPFADTPSGGSEYKLWVTPVAQFDINGGGTHGFLSKFSKTDNFKVTGHGRTPSQSIITGYKFYDFTEDGLWTTTEPKEVPIPGWRIEIHKNSQLEDFTYTDESGKYMFIREQDGATYTIKELAPGGFIGDGIPGAVWLATTPRQVNVVANTGNVAGPVFGNLRFERGFGLGRTKGFWHNDNGRLLLLDCEPQWRDALGTPAQPVCLRRSLSSAVPEISIFVVPPLPASFATAFDAWSNYIVGVGSLGHAGYLLSSQVGPTILNNTCGYMRGTIYIDRFQNGILFSLKDMLTGAIGLLCDPRAGQTGPNDPYPEFRQQILNCLNEFDAINSSGDLSKPQIVFVPAPQPGGINPY